MAAAFISLVLALGFAPPPPVAATAPAWPTFYVDGKHGSDTATGRSLEDAFKTVKRGMWELRHGGRLEIVGYADYVYYEEMTASQWMINGTPEQPVVIQGHGYGSAGAVRPMISGALVVSTPGSDAWTRPDPAYPDVWATPWSTPIPGYEPGIRGYRQERIFVDISQPLVRPRDVATLADLQAMPGSQYWDGTRLYVRLGGWGAADGASPSTDPNDHRIEIPYYKGILAASGSVHVIIRGLDVRHTTMGVGFTGTASHGTVEDVDASYNNPMGFFSAGGYHVFRRISGRRNTIQLVKLDNGAHHNLVERAVGIENLGQGVKLSGPSTAYNTVRLSTFEGGKRVPMSAGQYGGYIQGIDIEQGAHHNTIQGNTIRGMRRGLMLYQISAAGKPLTGNQIRGNYFEGNDAAIVLWDGKYSATGGSGSVTFSRNVYVGNTRAVTSESTTSNKVFDRETFFRTGSSKSSASSAFYLKAGRVTVRNSIIRRAGGYAFYARSGARITVSYTSVSLAGMGSRNSSSTVYLGAGYRVVNPGFVSEDPKSPDFLFIRRGSTAYTMSSSRGPIGARWR